MNGHTFTAPVLDRKQERIIGARAVVVRYDDVPVKLSLGRILQNQCAPLLGVGSGGARCIVDAIDRAWACSQKDGWVAFGVDQIVNDVASEIVRGEQPVGSNLPLETKVPLIDIRHMEVPRNRDIGPKTGKRDVGAERNRERISPGITPPRIVEGTGAV